MSAAQSSGKAEGGQLEERVDLSAETAEKIDQAKQLVSSGAGSSSALQDALALLAALEKRCRVGNDTPSLVKVCEASLDLCREAGDSEALLATLKTLSTRRSQKSKAIASLVAKCLPWVVDAEGDGFTPLPVEGDEASKARDELVKELRDITDGKMYLEAERARLTRTVAVLKEAAGDVSGAADALQEVHVETYGSISKREKVEFVLEQMRLTLLKRDYVRAHIVSGKIKRGTLEEEGMSELKVRYYGLMTDYHKHEKEALELAKCYHAIYSTPAVQEDEARWKEALTNAVVFLCLSEYSNEVKDMMERVDRDSRLEKIPECKETLVRYLKDEIIHYPLPHQAALESVPAFCDGPEGDGDEGKTLKDHWHTTFQTRIVQHNLRVTSLYYRRIRTSRLAQLLSLTPTETEEHISKMVSSGTLYAKIDRPRDIVRFSKKRSEEEVLSDWALDIEKLLGLVEETTYLIHKENMVQSH
ncbi:hypothetical protein ACHAWF_002950 [Thalassiosira exigua]